MKREEQVLYVFSESMKLIRTIYAIDHGVVNINWKLRNDLEITYRILDDFLKVRIAEGKGDSPENSC